MTDISPMMSLKEWLTVWLELYVLPVVKPSTYESYRDYCEKHIIPVLGDKIISEITAKEIQLFFNAKARCGNMKTNGPLSAKTLRNMRVVLDVAFKQALAEDIVDSNPVPLTTIRSAKTKRVQVMTDEMQETLERYLFSTAHRYIPAIQMALYTGMRRGEICALRWKDIDEKNWRVNIRETVRRCTNYDADAGEPKTKLVFNEVKTDSSIRSLLIPDVLKGILKEQKRLYLSLFRVPTDDDFVFFTSTGTMIDPDNLQHYFSSILRELKLDHVKFHAIRHTFATRAIENGIDVSTVSGILGHRDVTTTTHFYVHPRDKAMAAAMQTITPIYKERFKAAV